VSQPRPGGVVPPPADQPARTALAWTRTALGVAAVGVLVARYAWVGGGSLLLAAVPLVVAAAVLVIGARRRRRLRGGVPAALGDGVGALPAVAVVVIAVTALVALVAAMPTQV
jgi:hypothetical protein